MVDKFRAFFCISGPYLFRLIPYLLIRPHFTAYVTYSRPTKTVETTQSTRQDLATLPPSLLTDSEATAGMTQEFLSCLWERLRGGVAPVVHTSGEPSWLTSAWTSATEASVIAHLLPVTSTDIIQAIAGLLVHSGPQSKIGQLGWDRLVIDGHLEDPVLNKALGEFARLDHAQPDLAAQTLAQVSLRGFLVCSPRKCAVY